jgi:hypothetical protein
MIEMLEHDLAVLRLVRHHKIDMMFGTSVAIAHVSRVTRARSFVFCMDDRYYRPELPTLAYPFADKVVVPDCIRDRRMKNYLTHPSYHELAYLHPNHYQPDATILEEIGVQPGEPYFILRFVAWEAIHDIGKSGLSFEMKLKIIRTLEQHGKVFITSEGHVPDEIRPYLIKFSPHRIHHALNYATLLLSDGITMIREAAVLGVPSILCSPISGKQSVVNELEHRYGLTYSYLPSEEEKFMAKIEELIRMPDLKATWQTRKDRMLKEKIDLAQFITDLITSVKF